MSLIFIVYKGRFPFHSGNVAGLFMLPKSSGGGALSVIGNIGNAGDTDFAG